MRSLYREKYFKCGDYLEVSLYPVYKISGTRRKKAKATSECQKKVNQKQAEMKIIRKANANFTKDDYRLDLTYRDGMNPVDDEEAAKHLRNFLRRVKTFRKRNNLSELKYISVTEKGSRKKRYHHHLIISGGINPSELATIWGRGIVGCDPLQFDQNGIANLVMYMGKKPVASSKRWNVSKNLIDPPAHQRDGRISKRDVLEISRDTTDNRFIEKFFDGYYLGQAEKVYNDVNGGTYLYLRFYRKDAEFCRKKKLNR